LSVLSPLTDPLDIALARASLYEFIKAGWAELEPGTPFVDGWHIEEVANFVQEILEDWERCTRVIPGRTDRATPVVPQDNVINVPPGTMKSLIVSVFAPAWMWLRCPWWRALYASANQNVSLRDSVKCRQLIESVWYQQSFKPTWSFAADQNAKGDYKNTEGGQRQAITVGQRVIGVRADFAAVDDPLDATDAESNSKAARDEVLFWWDQAFYNRVNDPVRSKRLVIMQRLHEDDLAGHVKKAGLARTLILPMEFDPKRADPRDRRHAVGELLCPGRYPADVLVKERTRLGSWGYAGQMQQDPVPAGGGMFPQKWWRWWSVGRQQTTLARPEGCNTLPARAVPVFTDVTMSVDCNFKDAATSDYNVITVWGRIGADSFLLHLWRDRCGFTGTVAAIRDTYWQFPDTFRILIEDKANGSAIIETLKSEIPGIVAVNPEGGKESRAAAVQPEIEAGNVYLPEGASWVQELIEEFAKFPKGSNDDIVDSVTQYLISEKNSDIRRLEALCTL
jgi:predicted phage terminase large subunit-like protein